MTGQGDAVEPFYKLMLDYLCQLDGTEKFTEAFRAVDATNISPPPVEDPPFEFMVQTDWSAMASDRSRPLVDAIQTAMADLAWHVPLKADPAAGPGFAERAMSTGRVGPTTPLKTNDLAAGFFVVGPDVKYLDHKHEPEELYLPIAGQADFWNETDGWHVAGPDRVTIHPQWLWHAMKTGDAPVMIFWAWLGPDGFDDGAVLRPTLGGLPA